MIIQITLPILKASGKQIFEIEAASVEEAKKIWFDEADDTTLVSEELNVERVGNPVFKEI